MAPTHELSGSSAAKSAGNALAADTGDAHRKYVPALRLHLLTPLYDAVVKATTRERAFKTALIAQADVRPGQRVLDVGAGTGTLVVLLAQGEPNASVTGVDGDPAILRIATRKVRDAAVEAHFDCAMSYALPYEDASFDRVVSSLFFHHLSWPDKQRTLAELMRVLKPGGELHVADWGRPANALMGALFHAVRWLDGYENTQAHVEGRLIELFEQAGFIDAFERTRFNTMLGTLSLYAARKAS